MGSYYVYIIFHTQRCSREKKNIMARCIGSRLLISM